MNVLIVEDEPRAARNLQGMLRQIDASIGVPACIESIAGTVRWLQEHTPPDLILMDIQLADGLSFEIFNRTEVNAPVIFTTAYDEYAIRAFKVNSIDYLLKPVRREDLAKALQKWEKLKHQYVRDGGMQAVESMLANLLQNQLQYRSRFLVKSGQTLVSVPVKEVAYFFTDRKLTFLITQQGKKHIVAEPLDRLGEQIDPRRFYRLNRAFLASLDSIAGVSTYYTGKLKLHLKPPVDGEVLVSREKATSFKQWLDR